MIPGNKIKVVVGENNNVTIVTSVIQNLLTVVSFLLGTSSFILGLNIQNITKLSIQMNNYFKILILTLVLPAIFIIIYGIFLVGTTIEANDIHYLIILISLFVPSGAILFLLSKLKSLGNHST
ncbi:MAG: hypothetical protein ACE5SW_09485 [Nitrososphaeraceae archaeon]